MKSLLAPLLFIGLFVPGVSLALELEAPEQGAKDVKVNSYFQWQEVEGATKYVLDITGATQSEDNIPPGACSEGVCSFGFLDLTVTTIEFAGAYSWKVSALDAEGTSLSSSPPWSFTTEQAPVVRPPDEGGLVVTPDDLNPIASNNLAELFGTITNFLFGVSIALVPIVILYAGFLMLTAQGDPEKLSRARTILLWAVIAFAIILTARGIPQVLRGL